MAQSFQIISVINKSIFLLIRCFFTTKLIIELVLLISLVKQYLGKNIEETRMLIHKNAYTSKIILGILNCIDYIRMFVLEKQQKVEKLITYKRTLKKINYTTNINAAILRKLNEQI